jgi:SAM-dependent methyltransferase
MPTSPSDPTRRFSDRVDNYVRYRPGYPAEALDILRAETGLTAESVVADVGSGTGILSELFLKHGNTVYGIEPNDDMRQAAERLLRGYPEFHSVAGSAEATTLPAAGVDFVVAGQAFHWFDRPRARAEFARILRPGGWVVLLWNARRVDATPFLRDYEALLQAYSIDYRQVRHENVTPEVLAGWFADGRYQTRKLYNE